MKNGKRPPRKRRAQREQKSRGSAWAEQTRAQSNKLTDVERDRLLDRAMEIAYGPAADTNAARRR